MKITAIEIKPGMIIEHKNDYWNVLKTQHVKPGKGGAFNQVELKSVKKGVYAKSFAGGQVDITNGKFVFSSSEAYNIENGQITSPIKGASLIGSGFEVLKKVSMIGNDMQLDPGIGTCGKNGQGVPVGVGQPTLRIDGLTVGGTQTSN